MKTGPKFPKGKKKSRLIEGMDRSWKMAVDRARIKQSFEPLRAILSPEVPLKFTALPVTDEEFTELFWGGVWMAVNDGGSIEELALLDRAAAYRELLWESEHNTKALETQRYEYEDYTVGIPEIADRLGMSRYATRILVYDGAMPHHRSGRAVRVWNSDLENYIRTHGISR